MEQSLEQEFETYFGADLATVTQAPAEISQTLAEIAQATGTQPAVLWAIPRGSHLHLVLLTASGQPVVRDLYDVNDATLQQTVDEFHLEMYSSPAQVKMSAAQQLYRWMIEPFEAAYLEPEAIDTILFCLGDGLRSLPLAALHDGEQFLLEKYSLTRIPAFNLIQTDYQPLQAERFVAMGAAEFEHLSPLPAVPLELANTLRALRLFRPREDRWIGQSFLNQRFTVANLQAQLETYDPAVVHLATHAVFQAGQPESSYIQFWQTRLGLERIQSLDWSSPALELLVLSACRTAIGDREAELGFAGIALRSGAKSVLASIWNVSDTGTLALMSEFYRQLGTTTTKAEALRQAQLRLLRGEVRVEGDRLRLTRGTVPLPEPLLAEEITDLSAPYYWAAFTLISSPW
ncbi:MAG: CHAT domain-containing protein [Leptolyngbya sp. SIO4C1]|nr:CHAT domain-containing protein [Leptolyngbya sp. SIO4C1]